MSLLDAVENNDINQVRQLLNDGVDPNIEDEHGYTAFTWACESVNLDLMKLLLDNGVDPNNKNEGSETCLGWISWSDEPPSIMKSGIKLLLDAGYAINKTDESGYIINADGIDVLVSNDNNIEIVKLLLDNGLVINIPGYNILNGASENHAIQMVKLLLDNGADPNIRNQRGNGMIPLLLAIQTQNIEIVELLLDNGADPNITEYDSKYTKMPLVFALDVDNLEILKILLDAGADPFQKFKREFYDDRLYNILQYANMNRDKQAATLLKRHMNAIRMQSRIRGRQTRRKMRTQKAKQRASLMKTAYANDSIIGQNMRFDENIYEDISKYLSQMPYNPEAARRMIEEEENERMAEYLEQIGGRRRRRHRTRKKRYQFY